MKLRIAILLTVLLSLATGLFGQDLAGTWQGKISAQGRELRIVLKVANDGGKLSGQAFSIDQGAGGIPMNTITVQGKSVKFKIDAISASYEGNFSADGNAISGTLNQGMPVALNFDRATPQTAWAIPEPPAPLKPMDPAADPGIEVSTVKPSPPEARGRLYTMRGIQVMAINTSVMNLITFAYDLHERQVTGGPEWISGDKFEIVVKPDVSGQPNLQQMKKLFQKVLVERFGLKFHYEKREISVYAITLPPNVKHKLATSAPGQNVPSLLYPRPGLLPARNTTMDELAGSMQTAVLDRPVVNQTGIEGRFDFTLDWTPDQFQFASFGPLPPNMPDTGKPNIFQAYQDQLGLKLESTKAPVNVMLVEKVEKVSDN